MHWKLFTTKLYAILWLIALLLASIYIAQHIRNNASFDTDIFALLPAEEQSEITRLVNAHVAEKMGREVILIINSDKLKGSVNAANLFNKNIENSSYFTLIDNSNKLQYFTQLRDIILKHPHAVLTESQRNLLQKNNTEAIKQQLIQQLYSYGSLAASGGLENDPLGFVAAYLNEAITQPINNIQFVNNIPIIEHDNSFHALIHLRLKESPFTLTFQENALTELNNIQNIISQEYNNVHFISSGVIFHVRFGSEMAMHEISWMSSTSIISIILLFIFIFRSVKPFIITLLTISSGAIMGMAACLLIFDKVHLLTLLFGTSLVGISIDYALHFFVHSYENNKISSNETITHIRKGLVLGLITSLFGFIGICIVPFPGLQQMAIFCSAGLIFAVLCVLWCYPLIIKSLSKTPAMLPYNLMTSYCSLVSPTLKKPQTMLGLLLICCIGLGCLFFLPANDDVRNMQPLSPSLLKNDLYIANLTNTHLSHQFFIVATDTIEENLQQQEELTTELEMLKQQQKLSDYRAITKLIPSTKKQHKNHSLLQNFLKYNEQALTEIYHTLGTDSSVLERYTDTINVANKYCVILNNSKSLYKS